MSSLTLRDLSDSARPERVNAVAAFGFTERQARFLVRVLVHAGVFLERQYCTFAGVVHGQKSHDFLAKLVGRGFATVICSSPPWSASPEQVEHRPKGGTTSEPRRLSPSRSGIPPSDTRGSRDRSSREPLEAPAGTQTCRRAARSGGAVCRPCPSHGVGVGEASRGVNDPTGVGEGWPHARSTGSFTPRLAPCECHDVAVKIVMTRWSRSRAPRAPAADHDPCRDQDHDPCPDQSLDLRTISPTSTTRSWLPLSARTRERAEHLPAGHHAV